MTGTSQTQQRVAFAAIARALAQCQSDGLTGRLHVLGNPGGVVHLRQGVVVAVSSPGAPDAEVLLLRSGRISEGDWIAALRAGAETRSHQAELVARGSVGEAELRLVSMMAAQDGVFAAVAGTIEDYMVDTHSAEVLLPIKRGIDPDWLLRETSRRLDALASLPRSVSPYRERVIPVPGMELVTSGLTTAQQEILARATGRRSARDIAFIIGRSVYSVTIEVSRMLGQGLVVVVSGASAAAASSLARAVAPRARHKRATKPNSVAHPKGLLPRRLPGASGVSDFLAPSRSSGWQALPRLLSRMRANPWTTPGATGGEGPHEPEGKSM
ncbi:hypothetical protein [Allokutzneria oryzae]|uniref:MarR family transcriptional regulator n=1 Tax=Allokutzneria oryzae TaxID=1378989 RepID=A0ABV6A050_9PSEU